MIRKVTVVGALTNPEDGRLEAEALARDYAANHQRLPAEEVDVAA